MSPLVVTLLTSVVIFAACGGEGLATPTQASTPENPIPTATSTSYEELLHLFDYDQQAPLDIREVSVEERYCVIVHDLSYASPKGGRVPAYLVHPDGPGPFAGVLLQHGLPGGRGDMLEYARDLAKTGVVALLIDAPFARRMQADRGADPITFTEQDRDEQIQLIVDLRRAVDLLISRTEVDPNRIAFIGGSYGAAMGGLLAGVEKRIKAYVLTMGIGGVIARAMVEDYSATSTLELLPKEQQEQWLSFMEPIEPINFVGNAAPAALLFQSGRRDLLIPVDDATRFHQAGSEPKQVKWYDSGHSPPFEAFIDQVVWLQTQIGIDAEKITGPASPADLAEAFGKLAILIKTSDNSALQTKLVQYVDSAMARAQRPSQEFVKEAATAPILSGNFQAAEKFEDFLGAPREERGAPFLELGTLVQASEDLSLRTLYGKIFISMLLRGEPSEALAKEFFELVSVSGNEEAQVALRQTGLSEPPCR